MNRQFAEVQNTIIWKDAQTLWLPEKLKLKWDTASITIRLAKLQSWMVPSVDKDVESLLKSLQLSIALLGE